MNIVWGIEQTLTPSCGSKTVKVTPNDQWIGVKLSGAKQRTIRGFETMDITKDNQIFKNIPTHWYMIEN